MTANALDNMQWKYRKARSSDSGFVRELRNNPADRGNYRQQGYIGKEAHEEFWRRCWEDYYIVEIDGEAIGYFGFVEGDFRIAICREYRGQGVGTQVVKDWIEKFAGRCVYVHKENKQSLKIFLANGFLVKSMSEEFACLVIS